MPTETKQILIKYSLMFFNIFSSQLSLPNTNHVVAYFKCFYFASAFDKQRNKPGRFILLFGV